MNISGALSATLPGREGFLAAAESNGENALAHPERILIIIGRIRSSGFSRLEALRALTVFGKTAAPEDVG